MYDVLIWQFFALSFNNIKEFSSVLFLASFSACSALQPTSLKSFLYCTRIISFLFPANIYICHHTLYTYILMLFPSRSKFFLADGDDTHKHTHVQLPSVWSLVVLLKFELNFSSFMLTLHKFFNNTIIFVKKKCLTFWGGALFFAIRWWYYDNRVYIFTESLSGIAK